MKKKTLYILLFISFFVIFFANVEIKQKESIMTMLDSNTIILTNTSDDKLATFEHDHLFNSTVLIIDSGKTIDIDLEEWNHEYDLTFIGDRNKEVIVKIYTHDTNTLMGTEDYISFDNKFIVGVIGIKILLFDNRKYFKFDNYFKDALSKIIHDGFIE